MLQRIQVGKTYLFHNQRVIVISKSTPEMDRWFPQTVTLQHPDGTTNRLRTLRFKLEAEPLSHVLV